MDPLILIIILAFLYSLITIVLEYFVYGIEEKIKMEFKRIELNDKMKEIQKKINDQSIDNKEKEKYMKEYMDLVSQLFEDNKKMFFDIKRLKIMFFGSIVFMLIVFVILPKIKEKTVLVIPVLNIGLNPFWSFILVYFIFMLIQNIILSYWVKKYGKTFIKMEEKS